MFDYVYSVSQDVTFQAVNELVLKANIPQHGVVPATTPTVVDDVLTISFEDELTAEQETTIDAVVLNHIPLWVSSRIIQTANMGYGGDGGIDVIDLSSSWKVIVGVVTDVSFFIPSLDLAGARVTGLVNPDAGAVELRVVEGNGQGGTTVLNRRVQKVPHASGAWVPFAIDTDTAPISGLVERFLEAKLVDGATVGSIRFATMAMLEGLS